MVYCRGFIRLTLGVGDRGAIEFCEIIDLVKHAWNFVKCDFPQHTATLKSLDFP